MKQLKRILAVLLALATPANMVALAEGDQSQIVITEEQPAQAAIDMAAEVASDPADEAAASENTVEAAEHAAIAAEPDATQSEVASEAPDAETGSASTMVAESAATAPESAQVQAEVADEVPPSQANAGISSDEVLAATAPEAAPVQAEAATDPGAQDTSTEVASAPADPYAQPDDAVTSIEAEPATTLAFEKDSVTLGVGQTLTLGLKSDRPDGLGAIRYSSSKSKVVAVDKATGEMTAKRAGNAVILVETRSGLKATCKVTVKKAPKSIAFKDDKFYLAMGEEVKLAYTLSKDSYAAVRFETSNAAILTVDADGVVHPVAPGTAKVRVTTHNGKKDTCAIRVVTAPKSLTFEQDSYMIYDGSNLRLTPIIDDGSYSSYYIFESSNPAVAEIDAKGTLTAKSLGKATITATTSNGVKGSCIVEVCEKPTIQVAATEITLGLKDKFDLNPTLIFEGKPQPGGEFTYTFKSSKYASISDDGVITAKRAGSTQLRISAPGGISVICKITVKSAPKSVSFKNDKLILVMGQDAKLAYTLSKNSYASVRFESSNDAILTVDGDGTVHPVAIGTAKVRVKTHNGKSDICTIRVMAAPTSLSFEQDSYMIYDGSNLRLTPVLNADAYSPSYTFESSNPAVAEIDAKGTLTAKSMGKATITATASNGVKGSCTVEVREKPTIRVAATEIVVGVKDKFDLNPTLIFEGEPQPGGDFSYTFKSSKYATVDSNGVITGKRAGSTQLRISAPGGISVICKITVKKAPSSVKLAKNTLNLSLGMTTELDYSLSKNSAGRVKFNSSNPEVVSVQDDGTLRAEKTGSATITILTYNGKRDTCRVNVYTEPTSIAFTHAPEIIGVGSQGTLTAAVNEGSIGSWTFASSNPYALAVEAETGRYKALAVGSTTITVTSHNGLTATVDIKVEPAPTAVRFRKKSYDIGVGEEYRLPVIVNMSGNEVYDADVALKSSNTKVATVNSKGCVIGHRTGSATITAKTSNGLTATCKVTVKKAPTSIRLNVDELYLGDNETFTLKYKVYPSSAAANVTFTSSNRDRLVVYDYGLMDSRTSDSCVETITVSTYNGLTATCKVHLGPAPTAVAFPMDEITIYKGMKTQIYAYPVGGLCNGINYYVYEPEIANFDEDFNLVGKKVGRTRIEASVYNTKSGSLIVHVVEPPTAAKITLPDTLNVGYSYNLLDYVETNTGATPALSIASASVSNDRAAVFDAGYGLLLTVLEPGSFTLTVKLVNGKSVKKTLNATYGDIPMEDPITSPVDTTVRWDDFYGTWKLSKVSSMGYSLPPDVMGMNATMKVSSTSRLVLNGTSMYFSKVISDHKMLVDFGDGDKIACTLHQNGMLSFPMDSDLVLWFTK